MDDLTVYAKVLDADGTLYTSKAGEVTLTFQAVESKSINAEAASLY